MHPAWGVVIGLSLLVLVLLSLTCYYGTRSCGKGGQGLLGTDTSGGPNYCSSPATCPSPPDHNSALSAVRSGNPALVNALGDFLEKLLKTKWKPYCTNPANKWDIAGVMTMLDPLNLSGLRVDFGGPMTNCSTIKQCDCGGLIPPSSPGGSNCPSWGNGWCEKKCCCAKGMCPAPKDTQQTCTTSHGKVFAGISGAGKVFGISTLFADAADSVQLEITAKGGQHFLQADLHVRDVSIVMDGGGQLYYNGLGSSVYSSHVSVPTTSNGPNWFKQWDGLHTTLDIKGGLKMDVTLTVQVLIDSSSTPCQTLLQFCCSTVNVDVHVTEASLEGLDIGSIAGVDQDIATGIAAGMGSALTNVLKGMKQMPLPVALLSGGSAPSNDKPQPKPNDSNATFINSELIALFIPGDYNNTIETALNKAVAGAWTPVRWNLNTVIAVDIPSAPVMSALTLQLANNNGDPPAGGAQWTWLNTQTDCVAQICFDCVITIKNISLTVGGGDPYMINSLSLKTQLVSEATATTSGTDTIDLTINSFLLLSTEQASAIDASPDLLPVLQAAVDDNNGSFLSCIVDWVTSSAVMKFPLKNIISFQNATVAGICAASTP
jgi:hypothetical protein